LAASTSDEDHTAASYSVDVRVNWLDASTGQVIDNYRVDVIGDDGKAAYSNSKKIVLLLLQKIIDANGGTGWPFKQSNGKITS
jgi:hypothetical protein